MVYKLFFFLVFGSKGSFFHSAIQSAGLRITQLMMFIRQKFLKQYSNTRTMLLILFSLLCVKYIFVWFYQSVGFKGNITLNHAIVMFIHALQRM